MKTFEQLLKEYPSDIYCNSSEGKTTLYTGSQILRIAVTWLKQFQDEIDNLPTVDQGSIDYRDAQQELMDKLVTIKVEKIEGNPVSYLLKRAGIENNPKEGQQK